MGARSATSSDHSRDVPSVVLLSLFSLGRAASSTPQNSFFMEDSFSLFCKEARYHMVYAKSY